MTTQRASFYLSLLVHLVLAAGFLSGQHLLDKDPPVLVLDFSLAISEAMAGEPNHPLGATAAAPTSTPKTVPSQPQAAPPPVEPQQKSISQPVSKPVKVATPQPKKAKSKTKSRKVRKEPPPIVEKSSKPAPLSQPTPAETETAAPSTATTAAAGGSPPTTASPPGQTRAAASFAGGGGNLGQGSGMRYDFNYVRQRILRNLHFPATARKMGLSGKIVISFVLKENGQVEGITVVSSSGHEILDDTVVATIRRVAPFPRPPVSAQLMLPIVFHLKS
nr:energy transducer TonB [uncultured Desulfobulbus sp.]